MLFGLNWLPRLPYLSSNSPLTMAEVVTCIVFSCGVGKGSSEKGGLVQTAGGLSGLLGCRFQTTCFYTCQSIGVIPFSCK